MPSAYVIADVHVIDPEQYKAYMALTPAAVAAAGGEFVVRSLHDFEAFVEVVDPVLRPAKSCS